MNAHEARKITAENLKGPVIQPFVFAIDKGIQSAAEKGRNEVIPRHCVGNKLLHPNFEEWQAIQQHYVGLGFVWKDHPDLDPGHPASHSYTTLSW